MIKKLSSVILLINICLYSNNVYALSSSSYLISHIAFKSYDFENVLVGFGNDEKTLNLNDYNNKLTSLVILNNLSKANQVALSILKNEPTNQESLIVNLVHSLKNKNKIYINKYKVNNGLIDFIFFQNGNLKNNSDISNSFIEIVEGTFVNYSDVTEVDYNFLLFCLNLSTQLDQHNDKGWFLIAQIYQLINQYEKVEFYYKKIKPESLYYIDAQRNIAFNFGKLYSFNEAEKKLKDIILKSDNQLYLLEILADYYRVNKKYEDAIKIYSQLINDNSSNYLWNFYYMRGICYERLNNWKLAEKNFLQSLDIKSDSPNVLNYLAYGWIEKNINLDRSLDMLDKAYNANPDSYYILDSLAWAHYKKNNLEIAAELMEKVIEMAPGEAISLDHLGDIYFALNRKREAVYLWNQAKDLAEPEDNIIDKILQKLENYHAG